MGSAPEWWPPRGLEKGLYVQFADGRWDAEVGEGLALNEAAFDLIEPHVSKCFAEWTSTHRYAVFELSLRERTDLSVVLRQSANTAFKVAPASSLRLFSDLADWLESRSEEHQIVSILGI